MLSLGAFEVLEEGRGGEGRGGEGVTNCLQLLYIWSVVVALSMTLKLTMLPGKCGH